MAGRAKEKLHCFPIFGTNNKIAREHEMNFIKTGALLQEELISFCNGKNLPFQVFSAKEVMKMSDFTDKQILGQCSTFQLYNGVLDNQSVCLKKFHSLFDFVGMKGIVREIVIATQMGVHRNSLKLLGCCLETDFPVLVYEFSDHVLLGDIIYRRDPGNARDLNYQSLPWKIRLRIGSDISYALAYLQNGFSRPVIHRNLSAKDVYLDGDYVAKLTGFYMSVLIPEGEVHVMDAVVGTNGHSAPEYIMSGRLTEKTDVFLFGILLLELLCGQRRLHLRQDLLVKAREHEKYGRIEAILDPAVLEEVKANGQQEQLKQVLDLVLRCSADEEDDRPSIIDVTTELKKISDCC